MTFTLSPLSVFIWPHAFDFHSHFSNCLVFPGPHFSARKSFPNPLRIFLSSSSAHVSQRSVLSMFFSFLFFFFFLRTRTLLTRRKKEGTTRCPSQGTAKGQKRGRLVMRANERGKFMSIIGGQRMSGCQNQLPDCFVGSAQLAAGLLNVRRETGRVAIETTGAQEHDDKSHPTTS